MVAVSHHKAHGVSGRLRSLRCLNISADGGVYKGYTKSGNDLAPDMPAMFHQIKIVDNLPVGFPGGGHDLVPSVVTEQQHMGKLQRSIPKDLHPGRNALLYRSLGGPDMGGRTGSEVVFLQIQLSNQAMTDPTISHGALHIEKAPAEIPKNA